ncbi:MAG: hypothetical protein ACE37M_06615 [Henriciella sp.]
MLRYNSSNSTGNLYVIVVAGLAIALFTAIVLWPSGSKSPINGASVPDTPLTQALNDPATLNYLAALHRVKPKIADRLQAKAEDAISSGADNNQLAALVLAAYGTELEDDYKYLLRADVKHFDKMLRMSQQGLSTLSSKAPKYCRPAHYLQFEHMDPQDVATEMTRLFEYETAAYEWALRFNVMTLEAIESGRDNPQKYDRLTSGDQMALQNTMMRLMGNPQVTRLMQLQGKSEAEQKRAAMTMNFCGLGVDLLAAVNGLPADTKSRLLGEMQHQVKSGDLKRLMRTVQSGI